MSKARLPKIAISLGDCNGIGPEVVLKLLRNSGLNFNPILVGSKQVVEFYSDLLSIPIDTKTSWHEIDFVHQAVPGELSKEAGALAMAAVQAGLELCLLGEADGLVTAPISKEAVHLAGFDFPGHTEFLAEKSGAERELMIMVSGGLRVCVFTKHIPISQVSSRIKKTEIVEDLKVYSKTLEVDFGIENPRIAVLGLNPHAGEGGDIGKEEIDEILPALEVLPDLNLAGPFPADGFFGSQAHHEYDGVLAMYHDQGLVPFKALSFNRGVNFTAGLPIVRTSPDHGTAFGIAGKGIANEGSMIEAVSLAVLIANNRRERKEGFDSLTT